MQSTNGATQQRDFDHGRRLDRKKGPADAGLLVAPLSHDRRILALFGTRIDRNNGRNTEPVTGAPTPIPCARAERSCHQGHLMMALGVFRADGRVARPFGFTLTSPSVRLSQ